MVARSGMAGVPAVVEQRSAVPYRVASAHEATASKAMTQHSRSANSRASAEAHIVTVFGNFAQAERLRGPP